MTILGSYINKTKKIERLKPGEESKLIKLAQKGSKAARHRLIEANLWISFKVINNFSYSKSGIPLEDMVAEGNLGLFKAIRKFRSDKKCKFSTFAFWYVRQVISSMIGNQARLIRIPIYLQDKKGKNGIKTNKKNNKRIINKHLEVYKKAQYSYTSLDEPLADDGRTLAEVVGEPEESRE